MSKLVVKMAQANYERFMEGLIGCCEEPWANLPEQHRERLIEAQRAALAVVMAEMREPSETATDAGAEAWEAEFGDAGFGNRDVAAGQTWRAMLAQFEKEQAGG